MLIKRPSDIKSSEITPEPVFRQRREFVKSAVALGLLPAAAALPQELQEFTRDDLPSRKSPFPLSGMLPNVTPWPENPDLEPSSYGDVTGYNNYYEFGTGKTDPARNAHALEPHPWTVTVDGEAEHTGTYAFEDLISPYALEERIYRFRCVEAWSLSCLRECVPAGCSSSRRSPCRR